MAEAIDFAVPSLAFPPRQHLCLTGSEFAKKVILLKGELRDEAVLEQVMFGNVPQFMRTLCPVSLSGITLGGGLRASTVWVTPDYLCIGTDEDYVRFPLNPLTASRIGDVVGGFLPTRRIVNAIFEQAEIQLLARPKVAGNQMRSTQYVLEHNQAIQAQLEEARLGALVAGHKKDVVLCRAIFDGHHDDRVAIYGWAQTIENKKWKVWQGLNALSHDNKYEDYSHGIRLVAANLTVNGDPHNYADVVTDPGLAGVLSDEGALKAARYAGV